MKKKKAVTFTTGEQFKIMLMFLLIFIIFVTFAFCSSLISQKNNAVLSDNFETSQNPNISTSNEMLKESTAKDNEKRNEKLNEISSKTSVSGSDNISAEENVLNNSISEELTKELTQYNMTNPNKSYVSILYEKNTNEQQHNIVQYPSICQWPELPTGCEVVSLATVLNYYGLDVSAGYLADNCLPTNENMVQLGDFRYEFIGNPYNSSGFGCLAPCIERTAYNYFSENNITEYVSVDITGVAPKKLYNLIAQDIPVIVWVTTGWVTPYIDASWEGIDGKIIDWLFPEHCLVLTGFNYLSSTVTVSDVDCGYEYNVDMKTFESVYTDMGSNAVVVTPVS